VSAQTLRFAAHRDFSSAHGPASIAVGDLNNDGIQDLAVANFFSDTVAALVGNADGTFRPPVVVYLGPSNNPRSVAIADFNGDGMPDVVAANQTSNTVSLLPGNGNGTFQPAQTLQAGAAPMSIAAGDFSGDGAPDIAVANSGAGNVSVLIGNGNGTFQAARTFATGSGPAFVTVADVNRDGRSDLVTANSGAGTVSALLGNGDGNFQAPRSAGAGAGVAAVAVSDFDGDGTPDLATANNGPNTVSILRGNGDGTFGAGQAFSAGNGPTSVAAGDFNRDGKTDVAVTFYKAATSSGNLVAVLLGNGDGTLQAPRTSPAGVESWSLAVGDFNRDSQPDLAVANTFSTTISVLLGAGDGSFEATPVYRVGRNAESVVVGDFDKDGRRDLAVANPGTHDVSVLLGTGNGTFQAAVNYPAGPGPTAVETGDFNRDTNLDLVVTNYGSNNYYQDIVATTVSVLLGNGDGTFRAPVAYEAGSGPNDVAVADLNGDGIQDLAVADYGPNTVRATTVSVLIGVGDGTFSAPAAFTSGDGPSTVAAGDFNRDGRQDLAVGNYRSNNVTILLGAGNGTFQAVGSLPVGVAPWDIVVGDMNGDQTPDFAVTGHWSDIVSVLIGNGDGTFQPHRWFITDRGPTGVALADLNGDGVRDLITANYFSTTISVLLSNGNGTFQPAQNYGADLAPMSVAAGDFNGDGQLDLAVANYFGHTVSVLLNRTFSMPRVATPSFSPAPGTHIGSQTIALSVTTAGAAIHYTTDGSLPTAASPTYTAPFAISQTTTVRAMATASGMLDSDVVSATYTLKAPPPDITPASGTYLDSVTVAIGSSTSGGAIHYTTDGSSPTTASTVYTAPFVLTQSATVRAIVTAPGMESSDVVTATFALRAAAPAIAPGSGTYVGTVTVSMTTATSGGTIRYTTDGTAPTVASSAYSAAITLTRTTTIRAITVAANMANSVETTATYTVAAVPPAFSVPSGTYSQAQNVALGTTTSGATIYYTTDGSTPTASSTRYAGPVAVNASMTLRAIATAPGMATSAVSSAAYTLRAAAPTFNPPGGSYLLPQSVTISSATPGATIYYTTDGSTPTTSSTRYTGPVLMLLGTRTLRAIAVLPGWQQSTVSSATYTVLLDL
jgi:hypothetical protein